MAYRVTTRMMASASGMASVISDCASMMRARTYLPDRVLCSPSLRTRLTLHGIMAAFSTPPHVDYIDALYSGGIEAYFDALKAGSPSESLMIIGHNPMCEGFASTVTASGETAR